MSYFLLTQKTFLSQILPFYTHVTSPHWVPFIWLSGLSPSEVNFPLFSSFILGIDFQFWYTRTQPKRGISVSMYRPLVLGPHADKKGYEGTSEQVRPERINKRSKPLSRSMQRYALDLHSGSVRIESRPGHRPSCLRFLWFSSVPPIKRWNRPRLGHDHFLPNLFQFIINHPP
jgi:hypothetical protein